MREPSAAHRAGQPRRNHRATPTSAPGSPLAGLQRQAGNLAVTALVRGEVPVQRAVVANYAEIRSRLRPGTFGWVSDSDEYWITRQLIGIPPVDFHDTVTRMQASDACSVAGSLIARVERSGTAG
ncbi:hypothetical protein ACIQMJ_27095 [Actinosynnema sp. NPDC091369]